MHIMLLNILPHVWCHTPTRGHMRRMDLHSKIEILKFWIHIDQTSRGNANCKEGIKLEASHQTELW